LPQVVPASFGPLQRPLSTMATTSTARDDWQAPTTSMWSRMTGRGATGKTLPADLKRITHSGVSDIPKELLTPVVDAAANAEDRPEIMKHVRECLAEPSGKQWRRVYGALVLIEALVKNGSPQLFDETAEGRHFDLVQRLSFLEVYDNADKRIMNNIRKKAEALRKDVVPLIQNADGSSLKKQEDSNDTASTCSPGAASNCTSVSLSTMTRSSTNSLSTTGFGSDDVETHVQKIDSSEESKRTMIINNIVSVGHTEDTTSESEGDQGKAKAAVRYREPQQRRTAKERNQQSRAGNASSSDSEGASQDPTPQRKAESTNEAAAQTPAYTVDLLGL